MSSSTKSVRKLTVDLANDNNDSNAVKQDTRFNDIFNVLDKDGNGTLDRVEAYSLVRLWDDEKDLNESLKKNIKTILGVSAVIILLLIGTTFGATFVAVKASKDSSVTTTGALMTKDGSQQLSTVSHGTHFNLFNSSDDTPVCIAVEEFESMKQATLDGSKVVLDIEVESDEAEAENTHDIRSVDGEGTTITEGTVCYGGIGGICFVKSDCATDSHRALWESRGLSGSGASAESCECKGTWYPYDCGRIVTETYRGTWCRPWKYTGK